MELEPQEVQAAREVMNRAIRRLDILEYVILFGALVLALLGGALVAWVLSLSAGFPFRWSWGVASVLLFIGPGGWVYFRELRGRGQDRSGDSNTKP
jgi:uncharacterized membrane protein